jgi:amino-acid N-acetyltransferase
MDKSKLKEQVETIREGFGYVKQFKDRTFVIYLSSEVIEHPLFPLLVKDLVLLHQMGIKIVIVPGARTRIDEVLSSYNITCQTIDGVRISTPEAIPFIKMAAFDVSNRIMTLLAGNNTTAVIGNWVKARGIGVRSGIDFQHTGLVEDLKIGIVNKVLAEGLIPIFPNIGWNASGKPYNISSLELAYTLSIELQASKLFFITSFDGISATGLSVPEGIYIASDNTVSQLRVDEAGTILEKNKKASFDPRLELLSFAHRACKNGVARVHIVNGTVEGMILKEIFSNRGLGTMIYANQHDNIRPMTHADVPEVMRMMQPFVEREMLVPRTAEDLEKNLDDFAVYDVDGIIHASGALHTYSQNQGEIAALAVDELYANLGIGGKMISYLVDRARALKLSQVFVLTTQAADWFINAGFKEAPVSLLPESKQKAYNKNRNSKVLVLQLSKRKGIGE